MVVSVIIASRQRCHRPAELRIRDDWTPLRRPPTPHPGRHCRGPQKHSYYRFCEVLEYRYVSQSRFYEHSQPRLRCLDVEVADRRWADERGHVYQSEEQDLQRRKADQNAKIARRFGPYHPEKQKLDKKVRFASNVCEFDGLTETVRNLHLDGGQSAQRSGPTTATRRRHGWTY